VTKRFELKKDGADWALFNRLGRRVRAFRTKTAALTGGALDKLVGAGKVRIHRKDGQMQRTQTYPRSPA
jgi:hypothetical protein